MKSWQAIYRRLEAVPRLLDTVMPCRGWMFKPSHQLGNTKEASDR